MYVCLCCAISDKELIRLISEEGVVRFKDIRTRTQLGSQCGKCLRQAKTIFTVESSKRIDLSDSLE